MPAEARRILKSLQADLKVDSAIVNSPRSGVKQCKDDGDKYDILRIRTASATPVVTSSVAKKISVTTDAMHQYSAQALPLYRSNRRRLSYGAVPTPNPDVGGSWRMNRWRPPKRTLLFTTQELDKIINQFDEIDVNQVGIITQSQLGRSLGVLMSTPGVTSLLFNAFDPQNTNRVDITMYVRGMGVMMKGSLDECLEYAFKMIKKKKETGCIDRFELKLVIEAIHKAMEAVDLKLPDDPDTLSDKITLLMADISGEISLEQYKACVSKNSLFFQSLGLIFDLDHSFHFLKRLPSQPKKELSITFGHKDWSLVQNMMLGIRRSVSETTALPAREITSKDMDLTVDYKLAHEPNTLPWIFKDYSPMVFRKIREAFSCDARLYMFCLGPEKILGNAIFLGNLCALCEVVSTARSGSFFFKTNDGRFFIKTLPPDEFLFLRRILPSYYEYTISNPNTLLTRFYGMHSMRQGKNSEINFVVMENVFNSELPVDEQYDLKGSTIDRLVEVEEGTANPAIALKDMNFKRQLKIGGSMKALLMEQVEKDTRWMANMNICDYSFLVGIRSLYGVEIKPDLHARHSPEPSRFKSFLGGVLSADGEEVYYLAIIDILTQYVFKKKGERLLKSFIHNADQISAMPPKPYQLRFQRYVNSIIV